MSNRAKLIFDIETAGVEFDMLDPFSQEYIKEYSKTEEDLEEAKDHLGFSPLTGFIVAIGVLNPDTGKGIVYVNTGENSPDKPLPDDLGNGISIETGTEVEIIQKFWNAASSYQEFITFNGRGFDVPYLLIRSAVLGAMPTKNLMANRYLGSQPSTALHVDLFDQLTFYGASRFKNSSLHFWSKAFGVKSPKEGGVTGDDVKKLYTEGKHLDIARYNTGDLFATRDIYQKWIKYLDF